MSREILEEISLFNLRGTYDDYKKTFRSICTKEYIKEKL